MSLHPYLIEILLIEDNQGDIELTQEAFSESRVSNTIHVIKDGQKALSFLYRKDGYENAARPDLILLDMNLPGISGREILQTIKKDENLKTIPVVVLTSSDAERDIVKGYELQANCYIIKPITFDSFMEMIKSVQEFWLGIVKLPSVSEKTKREEYA